MLGLVFTFEIDKTQDAAPVESLISKRALDAVANAIRGDPSITFEEITDSTNAQPKIAVIFSDLRQMDAFTARLTLALWPSGIRIADLRAIKERTSTASSSEEGAIA